MQMCICVAPPASSKKNRVVRVAGAEKAGGAGKLLR